MTIDALTTFLGWSTVLNMSMLIVASLSLVLFRSSVSTIHGKLFGLSENDLANAYFSYLAQYKIAIFIFNLIPYIALKLMV
jgi:hypothetical protein